MGNRRLGTETILGGVFGIIAIAAAFLEMQDNGFCTAAIFGGNQGHRRNYGCGYGFPDCN